jgi:hypothetical protein
MIAPALICLLIAFGSSTLLLALRLRAPLGADEGYLWFGVQQLRRGRLPHRDFKSYEPGRYLWLAACSFVFGRGLLGVRLGTHLFFACALAGLLFALHRHGAAWSLIASAALVLSAWSHPQHKQFEHGWMLIGVAVLGAVLPQPGAWGFAGGVMVGLSLLFGFNLFLYLGAAWAMTLAAALVIGTWSPARDAVCATILGLAFGLAPFAAFLAVPGFAHRFYARRVGSVLARGSSNLPLARPWPWRAPTAALQSLDRVRRRMFAVWFLAMLLGPLLVLSAAFMRIERPDAGHAMMIAAAIVTLCAWHHAASRADVPHLAQVSGPFLLMLLLAASHWPWLPPLLALGLLWLIAPVTLRPNWARASASDVVGHLRLHQPPHATRLLRVARDLCADHAPHAPVLFVAPDLPQILAALDRDSPAYDTFCLYPASDPEQQAMIEQLTRNDAQVALISDAQIDGREELRFSRTHPKVWEWLQAEFVRIPTSEANSQVQVMQRR